MYTTDTELTDALVAIGTGISTLRAVIGSYSGVGSLLVVPLCGKHWERLTDAARPDIQADERPGGDIAIRVGFIPFLQANGHWDEHGLFHFMGAPLIGAPPSHCWVCQHLRLARPEPGPSAPGGCHAGTRRKERGHEST